MTLFNIFVYYNEERSCCHTLLSPFILLLYPFWIVPVSIFRKTFIFRHFYSGKGSYRVFSLQETAVKLKV
jgi:hypothetical protein